MNIRHTNGNVKLAVECTSLVFRGEVEAGDKDFQVKIVLKP